MQPQTMFVAAAAVDQLLFSMRARAGVRIFRSRQQCRRSAGTRRVPAMQQAEQRCECWKFVSNTTLGRRPGAGARKCGRAGLAPRAQPQSGMIFACATTLSMALGDCYCNPLECGKIVHAILAAADMVGQTAYHARSRCDSSVEVVLKVDLRTWRSRSRCLRCVFVH